MKSKTIEIQEPECLEDLELLVEGDIVKLIYEAREELNYTSWKGIGFKKVEEPRAYAGNEPFLGEHGVIKGWKFIKCLKANEDTQSVISEYCIAEHIIHFLGGGLLIGLVMPGLNLTHKVYVPTNAPINCEELTKLYNLLPIIHGREYDHYKEIIEKSGLKKWEKE